MKNPLWISNLTTLIATLALLAGCASKSTSPDFTALRVSNYRGETIAEYTARGPIKSVEGGYEIHAVERWSPGPHRVHSKYPYGWDTTVLGPRIQHWPTVKPAWLDEREERRGEENETWEPSDDSWEREAR